MKTILSLTILFSSFLGFSQNPDVVFGKWKTIDYETGKPKSIVELYKSSDGKLYGKIHALLNAKKANPVCDKCEDEKKDQPIEGMVIINGLENNDGEW